MTRRAIALLVSVCAPACLVLHGAARAADDDGDFYKGKQITLYIGSGPGGSYDAYARVFAPFYSKHIPGNPKIVLENMVGASGLRVANFMAASAPKDGTVIATTVSSVPTLPLMAPEGVAFDPTKFAWIGALTRDVFVGYVWHTSPIQTLEDTRTKEVVMGADSVGAAGANMAIVARELFGLKLKLVLGYADSASVKLAMDKGEVDGTFANAWSDLKTVRPEWLSEHIVRIIVQHGLERIPDLPNVPSLIELAKTPEDREAMEVIDSPQEFQKPYFAPPGTPPARLEILRRAFDAAVRDPDFLQAAAKTRLLVESPTSGEDLATHIAELAKTPPAVVQRLTGLFAKYK